MALSLDELLNDFVSQASQTTVLNVFTLNVWGMPLCLAKDKSKRITEIARVLARRDYDVVCLQELWLEDDFKLICRAVERKLPFTHFFKSGMIGSGICTLSKWPIVNTFFHKWRLNGYPHMVHHGDWYAGKGVGLTQINVNGLTINIYNTHLHAQYSEENDRYLVHRMTQGYETANFIRLTSAGAACSMLVGDLNSQPQDIEHRLLCEVANLKDTYNEVQSSVLTKKYGTFGCREWNCYTDDDHSKKHPFGVRLDYILYHPSPGFKVDVLSHQLALPHAIPGTEISFSDHEAVEATIQIESCECDSSEQTDLSKLENLVNEIGDICEHGKKLVWKNSAFFGTILVVTQILLGLLAYYQCPMTFVTIFFLCFLVIAGMYAVFMTTIWHKLEMQNILGIQNDLVALRNRLAISEKFS